MKMPTIILVSMLFVASYAEQSTDSLFSVVLEITGETEPITSSLWHPVENTIAVVTESGRIRIVDVENRREVKRLPESFRWVGKPAWNREGSMFAYLSNSNSITLLDSSYSPVRMLEFAAAQDSALWWSEDGNLIAFPDTLNQMQIWESTSWANHALDVASDTTLWAVHDDLLAAFDQETHTVDVWSIRAEDHLFRLIEQSNPLSGIVFNHDGSLLATIDNLNVNSDFFVGDPGIRIWRTDTGELIGRFDLEIGTNLIWSPLDNRFLAFLDQANGVGKPSALNIVNESFELRQTIDVGSTNYIVQPSIDWTLDGRHILFAENRVSNSDYWDDHVQLWVVDSATLEVLDRYPILYEPRATQWSFDGQYLLLQSNIVQILQPSAAQFSPG